MNRNCHRLSLNIIPVPFIAAVGSFSFCAACQRHAWCHVIYPGPIPRLYTHINHSVNFTLFGLSQFPRCIGQCRSSSSISGAWWELWVNVQYLWIRRSPYHNFHHASETKPKLPHSPMHHVNCEKPNSHGYG